MIPHNVCMQSDAKFTCVGCNMKKTCLNVHNLLPELHWHCYFVFHKISCQTICILFPWFLFPYAELYVCKYSMGVQQWRVALKQIVLLSWFETLPINSDITSFYSSAYPHLHCRSKYWLSTLSCSISYLWLIFMANIKTRCCASVDDTYTSVNMHACIWERRLCLNLCQLACMYFAMRQPLHHKTGHKTWSSYIHRFSFVC